MRIFLDTETTGLAAPRLVEIAFGEEGHVPMVLRCRPGKPIELDATVINSIRNKDVEHLPLFSEHPGYAYVKKLLEENTIVAHNASFDAGVLANEGIHVTDIIDTKTLAMKKWPEAPSYRLQHLRYWLDLPVEALSVAHTASGDVEVLMALWQAIEAPSEASYGTKASQTAPRRTSVKLPRAWSDRKKKKGKPDGRRGAA